MLCILIVSPSESLFSSCCRWDQWAAIAFPELLLRAGAYRSLVDDDGSTPGMIADENCYRDAAKMLGEQHSSYEKPQDRNGSGQQLSRDPAFTNMFPLTPQSIRITPYGYGCTGKSYALEALTPDGR